MILEFFCLIWYLWRLIKNAPPSFIDIYTNIPSPGPPAPPLRRRIENPRKLLPLPPSHPHAPSSGTLHLSTVSIDTYDRGRYRIIVAAGELDNLIGGITGLRRLIDHARATGYCEDGAAAVRVLLTGHAAVVGAVRVQLHGVVHGVGAAEVAAVVRIVAEQVVAGASGIKCGAGRDDCVGYG